MSKKPKLLYTTFLEMVNVEPALLSEWEEFKNEMKSLGVVPSTKDQISVFKDCSFEIFFETGSGSVSKSFDEGLGGL